MRTWNKSRLTGHKQTDNAHWKGNNHDNRQLEEKGKRNHHSRVLSAVLKMLCLKTDKALLQPDTQNILFLAKHHYLGVQSQLSKSADRLSDEIWSSKACSRPRGVGWREGAQGRTRARGHPAHWNGGPQRGSSKVRWREELKKKRRAKHRPVYLIYCVSPYRASQILLFLGIEGLWQPCVKQVYQCHFSNRLEWWWAFFNNKVFFN